MDNNKLEEISGANTRNLHIISDNVLAMIKKGEPGWERLVPHKVEEDNQRTWICFGLPAFRPEHKQISDREELDLSIAKYCIQAPKYN
jgi:hypothetical protein